MAGISVHALGRKLGMYVANKTINLTKQNCWDMEPKLYWGVFLNWLFFFQ